MGAIMPSDVFSARLSNAARDRDIGCFDSENIGELRGQEVAGIHGQHLPHLHGGAAHGGELVGYTAGVGGSEQQFLCFWAVAGAQLPRALGHHATGNKKAG